MATYKVQDPQGKIMTIEGPEGATDEQLLQVAAKEYYAETPYTPDYTLGELTGRAFGRADRRKLQRSRPVRRFRRREFS